MTRPKSNIKVPASPFDQYVMSKFLQIRPQVLGGFEIVLSIVVFALTIWEGLFYILWASIFSFLIGSLTVLAAHKRTIPWIRTSQSLNYLSVITSIFSLPFHGFANDGMTLIVLMVCDALVVVFSITVASTSCCRPKRRPVQRQYRARVYHMNSPLPVVTVNNIVYVTQSNSAATPTIFSSVQYGQPSEYGPAFSR